MQVPRYVKGGRKARVEAREQGLGCKGEVVGVLVQVRWRVRFRVMV